MNKSESDTLISESKINVAEVPKMLTEYSVVAFALIQKEEYHKALQLLSQSEELLEAVTSQGGVVDLDYILITVHNSAYCYLKYFQYRLGMLQECASYMDACIYNSESKKLLAHELEGSQTLLKALKKEKYEAGIYLYYSVLLSMMENHEQALKHAQTAFKKSLMCMKICYKACLDHLSRHNKLVNTVSIRKRMSKQSQYNLIESPHYQSFHKLVSKAMPFLQYFHNKYHSTSRNPQKINIKAYVLNYYSEEDWANSFTLEDIMSFKPLSPLSINNTLGIHSEIAKENMVNKLVLIIASMFSIACELRFSEKSLEESKGWHKRTIQNAMNFFPLNSLIVRQLKENYGKEFNNFDNFNKKPKLNTFSSRVRTPMPPSSHKPWSRNKSYNEKTAESTKSHVKSLKDRHKNKTALDDSKAFDYMLNSYNLY